ncbi:Oidioi.mRNA.OKI2018_I69.chr1.g3522.t2.cds [Oikopleura dioica]|uniref:Oidioi.mRNA.OKI2018_I69.chr1.g3522.t2.cds n=1 Tax=Oikopleura dioica TaxID=34765 RepID=A0ABN7SZU2_OIKDI|nr:Oidioi.mRNA.OKI2018_I69.chr1.g3522.t2.cds [Oikopleura dioica]
MSTSVEDGDGITDQKPQNQQIQATRPLDTVVTVSPCENASEPQSTEILEETCTRSEDCLDLEAQGSRSKSNTGASDRSLPCPAEDTQLIRTNSGNMTSRSNRYNNKTVIIASLVFWGTVLIAIVVTVIVLTGRNIDEGPLREHSTTSDPLATPAPLSGTTSAASLSYSSTLNTSENATLLDSMIDNPLSDGNPS